MADLWIYAYDGKTSGPPTEVESWSQTDADGKYTLRSLSSGSYKIYFGADNITYATNWYNSKNIYNSAAAVSVTVPGITSGIDAVLEPPRPATISPIIQLLLLK